jgi:hypothetical protein
METVLTCRLQLVFRPRLRLIYITFERSAKWTKPQQLNIPATDNDGPICHLAKVYLATWLKIYVVSVRGVFGKPAETIRLRL